MLELSAQNGVQSLNTFFADSIIVGSSISLKGEFIATRQWALDNVLARFG
jgi:hypothetical protein